MGGITMGGQREYIPSRGFTEYLYHQIGDTLTANGVSGKVIARQSSDNLHDGLPKYSNTSKVYFKLDDVTKMIEQARVYENRRVAYDFDWGHTHKEYIAGIVHVHEWYENKNGKWIRSNNPRLLNNDEITRYGNLLKKANPNVRFR